MLAKIENKTSAQASTKRRRRPRLFKFLYALYILALVALAYRAFMWWQFGVKPSDLSNKLDANQLFYPEITLRKIAESRIVAEERNVLLLGGSVAEQVGSKLESALSKRFGMPVNVHNTGVSAHTTQDSLNKLSYLVKQGAEFDAILIYHGINDVRMNCVDAKYFRNDYTHCVWYESFQRKLKQGNISTSEGLAETFNRMIILGQPDTDHVDFGVDIKTGPAFQAHIESILAIADEQQTPVVLLSFANHFVDNYSSSAFQQKQLGYSNGTYELATEVWGHPENVRRGVIVHNNVIRKIVATNKTVGFIDMENVLTDIHFFSDVCHLSPAGISAFAETVSLQMEQTELLTGKPTD